MFNSGFEAQRFFGNDRGDITKKVTISRSMYPDAGTLYPAPICPLLKVEGKNNVFSATVSSGGAVIEKLKDQSGAEQMYTFSWYPPNPGSYVITITVKSDGIFNGKFIINAEISS